MPNASKLTPTQVKEIYAKKIIYLTWFYSHHPAPYDRRPIKGMSMRLSNLYGVSAKTIRDIWNRRSWTQETCSMWYKEPQQYALQVSYAQFISKFIGHQQQQDHCPLPIVSWPKEEHGGIDALLHDGLPGANDEGILDPFHDDWPYWCTK